MRDLWQAPLCWGESVIVGAVKGALHSSCKTKKSLLNQEGIFIILIVGNNKVLGYPSAIYNCVDGSGSYFA